MNYINLFSPFRIGDLQLKNRLVMPAMATNYAALDGSVTERLIAYLATRAVGGVGLIIVEMSCIEYPRGKSTVNQLSLHDDRYIVGLKALVETIHRHGAAIAFQLNHAGKRAFKDITGVQPVSCSSIPVPASDSSWYEKGGDIPRELTVGEIRDLAYLFGDAARRAKAAGADAVEIHGAHGYLINQFLSPYSNHRKDQYGGSIEKRSRFACEVVEQVRSAVGEKFPIIFRISAWEGVEGGLTLDITREIVPLIEKAGVNAFHVSAGSYDSMYLVAPASYVPFGHIVHLAEGVKKSVNVPVIAVGRINDPDLAENILVEKKADFIAMGRALLADPDLPNKARDGQVDEIRRCIGCNQGCVGRLRQIDSYGRGMVTCTVNPMVGRELDIDWKPAPYSKNVMVIGGGPAGLETSLVVATKGHNVILYEKEQELGGQLLLASKPPFKSEITNLISFYQKQIQKKGAKVLLGIEATDETIKRLKPDAVVIATGAKPLVPRIDGVNQDNVVTSWDILAGKSPVGNTVAILGGGTVGCETAHFLADNNRQREITIIEQAPHIASGLQVYRRHYLVQHLDRLGIRVLTHTRVEKIEGKQIICSQSEGGKKKVINADTIILAMGAQSDQEMAKTVQKEGLHVYLVGDCFEARDMLEAIHEAFKIAMKL